MGDDIVQCAVVAGGNGFLGQALVKRLLEKGCFVYNITKNKQAVFRHPSYRELCGSTQELLRAIQMPPDVFFDLAWSGTSGSLRSDIGVQLENVRVSCDYVKLTQELKIPRFVYFGSIMEFDCLNNLIGDNAAEFGIQNIYSASKLTAHMMTELFAKSYQLEFLPVIISNIYGEGEKTPRFINSMVRKMGTCESVDLTEGSQLYDFIYITDAVEMVIQIAEAGRPYKKYYIGNQKQYPLKEFVLRMKTILDYKGKLNFGAVPFMGIALRYDEFDVNSFYEDFDFRPEISFEEGVRKLFEECKRNGEF